ncbi:MAG: hypothetical protein R3F59_08240 [Myxococcota bacterium]
MRSNGVLVMLAAAAAGCNRYDLFRLSGYQQESFSNKADVLFVIDNSESMLEESSDLATNFAGFIGKIDELEQNLGYDGLPDAVTNFVDYVQNRGGFVDYQFGITTTDALVDAGELQGPLVARGDDQVAYNFTEGLVCEATCFPESFAPQSDPAYNCGDPLDAISQEFLSCACGGSWRGNCGGAQEMGIEAVYLAMCRAVPNPPVDCFADVVVNPGEPDEQTIPSRLQQSDIGSNAGMLRENANFIPIIVTDEGDGSIRTDDGEEIPEEYVRLFEQFGRRMSWVVIGPGLDADNKQRCPGTGTDWGVTRYNYMVHVTDGLSIDIYDDSCNSRDFEDTLQQVADLLTNLVTQFPLQSVPVPGTIQVLVDGKLIDEAEVTGTDSFGLEEYSDGWTYSGANNAVVFHGTAIPGYDARIEVYYLPIDGMPRDLPF